MEVLILKVEATTALYNAENVEQIVSLTIIRRIRQLLKKHGIRIHEISVLTL